MPATINISNEKHIIVFYSVDVQGSGTQICTTNVGAQTNNNNKKIYLVQFYLEFQ